jgi:cobalt/nickel transport system permease protein
MLLVERLAHSNRWTARHPAEKVILGGGLLVASLLMPPLPGAAVVAAAALGAALLGARLPIRDYMRVLALPAGFLAMSALSIAVSLRIGGDGLRLSISDESARVAIETSLRALAATSSLLLVILTTPFADVLGMLRRVGLPAAILDVMLLIYRFVAIALDVAANARTAQESRLGYVGIRRTIRSTGMLAAALLPRVLDRAARMHIGLAARGYSNDLRVLSSRRAISVPFVASSLVLLGMVALLGSGALTGFGATGWAL